MIIGDKISKRVTKVIKTYFELSNSILNKKWVPRSNKVNVYSTLY